MTGLHVPISVSDLDVSSRARNSLNRAGIYTIFDLRARSADDLLDIPYLGTGQLTEIQAALAWHGMSLAPDVPEPPPPSVSARQMGQRARRQKERERAELEREWHKDDPPAPAPLVSARQIGQRARRRRERAAREGTAGTWLWWTTVRPG